MNSSKYKLRNFYVIFLPVLILLSNVLPYVLFDSKREFQLVEIIQIIVLMLCLILHIKYRKIFIKISNYPTFILRKLLILVLFYEELSFLTYSLNNTFNIQNEFNIHNSKFFNMDFFSLAIPYLNIEFSPTLQFLLFVFMFFILDYGSYFPILKKFKYFFIEKEYAIFTFSYLTFIFVNKFSFLNPNSGNYIIQPEIFELFIYIFLLLDTLQKRKIIKNESIKIFKQLN